MNIELYLFFLITTVILIMVPGPAAITVATQGASHHSKNAFLCVLGVASADALFFLLSATGIASLIVASNLLFSIIKWFGVAYLIYLGASAIFSKAGAIKIDAPATKTSPAKAFSQGLIIQLSNPKALMYFSALLPQFIDPNKPIIFQIFLMGLTCFLADLLVYSLFNRIGAQLAKKQMKSWIINIINKAAGVMLITTGIKMTTLENL
ncbi:LysE family translocator [Candidatus Venteria ishoeyi]|uniref:Homoserine/homoserine lactone efflux protein n=1 Tax=Candidatus Venteria ishoeyi TaxID=1899563 RepID=A0A1H6FC72_9GAMM|nr:LysE family translocator [Candidatus Venteria ishoeyi]SEH06644.1 Homoserine/homoserine lactone efflux protein [Candidatus Venteria ishoeyi]